MIVASHERLTISDEDLARLRKAMNELPNTPILVTLRSGKLKQVAWSPLRLWLYRRWTDVLVLFSRLRR